MCFKPVAASFIYVKDIVAQLLIEIHPVSQSEDSRSSLTHKKHTPKCVIYAPLKYRKR